jgi:hypothetical protein
MMDWNQDRESGEENLAGRRATLRSELRIVIEAAPPPDHLVHDPPLRCDMCGGTYNVREVDCGDLQCADCRIMLR